MVTLCAYAQQGKVLIVWFRPYVYLYVYIYVCICDQKKRLFCILLVVIHRKSLCNACFYDLHVAKDAVDS